jgi:ABC-2 type transport system ATP-binding protein
MIISKGKLVASDTPDKLMELMKGETSLDLAVLGTEEGLKNILGSIEGINGFEVSTGKNEGEVAARLQVDSNKDIRKELFYRLASSDMPIMQLKIDEKSLEDVFLELTGDNGEDDNNTDDSGRDDGKEKLDTAEAGDKKNLDEEVTENDSDI